jgi:hypothetical protein
MGDLSSRCVYNMSVEYARHASRKLLMMGTEALSETLDVTSILACVIVMKASNHAHRNDILLVKMTNYCFSCNILQPLVIFSLLESNTILIMLFAVLT